MKNEKKEKRIVRIHSTFELNFPKREKFLKNFIKKERKRKKKEKKKRKNPTYIQIIARKNVGPLIENLRCD